MNIETYNKMSSAEQLAWRQTNGHKAYMQLVRGKVSNPGPYNREAAKASAARMASELMKKVK